MMLLVLQQELSSLQWDIQNKDWDHAEWHIKDLLKRVTKEMVNNGDSDTDNT